MLTRLYIDNFRCFVNFECRFGNSNKQLIIGRNGSGKTSLFEVLLYLRQFVVFGQTIDNSLTQPTSWLEQNQQIFEIEAAIHNASYVYRLIVEANSAETQTVIKSETVHCNRTLLFGFTDGQVHLYNDRLEQINTYPFDSYHSAFATISENSGNTRLLKFKKWFSRLACFKLNPFASPMPIARAEQALPYVDLSNFVDWYRHLERFYPEEKFVLFESLSAAIDGFQSLKFKSLGESVHILFVEFASSGEDNIDLLFERLSDGQRCLVYLYTILHFIVAKGGTVIIDEPENFLSLREIQPWLMALGDVLDEGRGQVFLISHHPEFINQWAPRYGVQLIRDGAGPVRAKRFADGLEDYDLPAAELVARGWELE